MSVRFKLTDQRCPDCGSLVYDSGIPAEGYYCLVCQGWMLLALIKAGGMRAHQHPEELDQILALEYTDPTWSGLIPGQKWPNYNGPGETLEETLDAMNNPDRAFHEVLEGMDSEELKRVWAFVQHYCPLPEGEKLT